MSGARTKKDAQSAPRTRSAVTSSNPRRRMDLIASVSRSSGLDKDGDALRDPSTQDEYRVYIQAKIDDLWTRHPKSCDEKKEELQKRVDSQETILILLRKLREGIVSSKRAGKFALEVYETSLALSVLFDSPRQISAIVPSFMAFIQHEPISPDPERSQMIVIGLLQQLITFYPSQREYNSFLHALPIALFTADCSERVWITSLATCLRTRNYAQLEQILRPPSVPVPSLDVASDPNRLAPRAIYHLIDSLRGKARDTSWTIMRSAYRELLCQKDEQTRDWLQRSLGLSSSVDLDDWFKRTEQLGHVRRKEGVEDRWIVSKLR
ncbi:unnamed protein product [Mycena citricolor]|uniref:Uncharacterized protein n=1 Tax=Mycena citricolor TaxID=2018698 RepID=A0AAD2JWN0_9AGAR|nr:unnamed protein product [Mycena citricolor]